MVERVFNYHINEGFLWSEVDLKGDKKYYIEGFASTIDQDKAGEVISIEAQQDIYNQILSESITMDLEHEEWYDDSGKILPRPKNTKIPVAKIVSAELRPQGVWVKAEINRNLKSFSEIWGSIKEGFLKAFSIAFYPVQKAGNIIKSLNLVNITLTGSPVNPNATFSASMKSALAHLRTLEQEQPPTVDTGEDTKIVEEEIKMTDDITPVIENPTPIVEAEVKAESPVITETHEVELKSLRDELENAKSEIAKLKAELEKPIMKAIVEETPKIEEKFEYISPLKMVR